METEKFDYEAFKKQAIQRLKDGKGLKGAEGAFTLLIKSLLEDAMEGELEEHIADQNEPNRKNGKGRKVVRTSRGQLEIRIPRQKWIH